VRVRRRMVRASSRALPACSTRVVYKSSCTVVIIGTVHFSFTKSAQQCSRVIQALSPDAVVVEIDRARLNTLVDNVRLNKPAPYGRDLYAACRSAARSQALLAFGDLRTAQMMDELANVLAFKTAPNWLDIRAVVAALTHLMQAIGVGASGVRVVDVAKEDLAKLLPLAPLLPMLVSGAAALAPPPPATSADLVSTNNAAQLVVAYIGLGLFAAAVDAVLVKRDEVLASSVAKACDAAVALRERRETCHRVRVQFDTRHAETERRRCFTSWLRRRDDSARHRAPLFALARPLAGEERRLNLYEPRYLALLDNLAASNGGNLTGARMWVAPALLRSNMPELLLKNGSSSPYRRYGDTVVDLGRACRVEVVRSREGVRPVTNNRKVEVWIRAMVDGDDDDVDSGMPLSLSHHPCGYLEVAPSKAPRTLDHHDHDAAADAALPTVVAVVGLAHVNGVASKLRELV